MSIACQTHRYAAAVLAAAVLFLGSGPAVAQTQSQTQSDRFPAGPANMFRPGAAFTLYENTTDPARVEGLNAALNTMTAQSQEMARAIAEARTGIAEGVAQSDHDGLARDVATSIEGTFSIVVQAGFVRAMAQTDPSFGRMLQTAQMNVHLPGGQTVQFPVLMAAAIHSLSVIGAGDKLRAKPTTRDLSGNYVIATRGDCAVADGPVTLAQKDFVLEASGDEKLALYGTVGEGRIYLVANEQRYARITQPNGVGNPNIEVPDKPSDLFESALEAPGAPMEFHSITRGSCSFALTPAS